MSKMHVNHLRVTVNFYSVKTSGVNITLNSKRYRTMSIWTFSQEVNKSYVVFSIVFKEKRLSSIWTLIPLASLKFLISSL